MDTPISYIPMDRRQALARGESLPERTAGAALFADISGFTPLTEALARELGARRGAEELTVHLNRVYNALIAELHRYGGSVVGFSGDAITCWLDGDHGHRAVAAALAMQEAMEQFGAVVTAGGTVVSLAVKVAVATGPIRRMVVGDPGYVLIDTMVGKTLERLAAAEHQASRGEIVLDEATAARLSQALAVSEWRDEPASGQRFAVTAGLSRDVAAAPWPDLPAAGLSDEVQSAWLLPPVYERLKAGLGNFLAELRPAFALFLRFTGIDYDHDPEAPAKLDAFIREVQRVLRRLDGSMIQLTIGDKGSYMYAAFGAPVAHEDDGIRAANAALALWDLAAGLPFLEPVQIGITGGRMRTGAYGSTTRRTYGVLGDAVNLSARLMAAAKPGQILVSDAARAATGDRFLWETLPSMKVKGKSEPVAVSRLLGLRRDGTAGKLEPDYRLPMVGRTQELALIRDKVEAARRGHGQIVAIIGDAGMGKSRLAAEAFRVAREAGFTGLGGECQSYGTTTSYLVWQGIWRGFFALDPDLSAEAQIASLEAKLRQLDDTLLPRLPLLGAVLNLAIPENDLTRSLDAKVRKTSLEELLVRCLQARARTEPLLLVLEDCHWLDDLSRDLIAEVGRSLARSDAPILMLLVYRPLDRHREPTMPVEQLPHFTPVVLAEFSPEETQELVALKLGQLFGEDIQVPPALLDRVTTQAAGNPFYIEELLNYLQSLGIDVRDPAALQAIDLPNSIHALVLSRIDRLSESEQLTIKVASVIGRLFRAAMVWGIYPELPLPRVQHNLEVLSDLELTPMETPEPEMTYLFKHVITQQVAYESLLYATRATLHEQIGLYFERTYPDAIERYVNLLAFHFEHSQNAAKKREYLLKAGEMAQKGYALGAAISYFEKGLPLLQGRARVDVRLQLGQAYELSGAWDQAGDQYRAALAESQGMDDREALAWCQVALGELSRKRNRYETASTWFAQARETFEALDNRAGIGQVLHYAGTLASQQGDKALARQRYDESLALRRELGDRENEANLLNNLGIVARDLGDVDAARRFQEESLAIREAIGNRWAIAASLNNLGHLAMESGEYARARQQLDRALLIWREIGERWATTNTLHNLANVAREEGDLPEARRLYAESIDGWRYLDDRWGMAYWLEDLALLRWRQGAPYQALQLVSAAAVLREAIGAPRPPAYQAKLEASLAPAVQALDQAARSDAQAAGAAMSLGQAVDFALATSGP